jgi:alanine dehydrogenase
MGARVTMLDIDSDRLEAMDDLFCGRVQTMFSNGHNIEEQVAAADLVIGAVLLPAARAPRLVSRDLVRNMSKGSAVIDVAVDQGGCVETVRRTTHDAPTYIEEGVVHYGVANMPGAVACTSTYALAHATAPYLEKMAIEGVKNAVASDEALKKGVNTVNGYITQQAVAHALEIDYRPISDFI